MIIDRIQKSINEAKQFLIDSIIEIDNNGQCINGFPHYRGKKRITEYGGTSSAISALNKIGTVTNGIYASTQNALKWLWSKQNSDGSWQSSQLYCSEVTAGALNDLANIKSEIPQNTKKLACQYIKSCYEDNGYFKSDPHNIAVPHIFTTYICTNALMLYDDFDDNKKEKIKKWIIDSHAVEKNGWGISKDYLSMWATNQAVDLLIRFKKFIYPKLNKFKLIFFKYLFLQLK